MSDKTQKRGSSLIWILLLIVVVAAWLYLRSSGHDEQNRSQHEADYAAALAEAAAGPAAHNAQWDVDPDDIVVDFEDDASAAAIARVEKQFGIDLVLVSAQSADEQMYRAHVPAGSQTAILAALSQNADVEIAEPEAYATLGPDMEMVKAPADGDIDWKDFPNDPKYKYQWHLEQIKMPAAWKLSSGEGVIVAVLDTGVAYEDYGPFHMVEDLAGVKMVKPYDFVNNDRHANDDHGHGTHVAGTIAQATNNGVGVSGVGRSITIMPLKVLSGSGSGSVAGIADAIRYAADEGAHVINMSLGSRFGSKVLERAVNYAHSKGVTVVCAAGNDGRGKVGYPAAYAKAVAVAATQFDEKTTFYSNWGKALDVAAPGGNTRIDQNGDGMMDGVLQNTIVVGDPSMSDYFGFMGTSMASPHAAGVAALIVGEGVTNPDAVEKILEDSSFQPKGYSRDRYGAGIIDAEAAVLAARGKQGGWQLLFGLLLAGGLAFSMRKKGLGAAFAGVKTSYVVGTVIGASGLFFLPYLAPSLSSLPVIDTLTRGLPSWGLSIFGVDGHGNALVFSALIPTVLIVSLLGVRRLRGLLAGLAVGVAGHLLFHSAVDLIDVRWMPSSFGLEELWLAANAAICVGLAGLVLRGK